MAEINACAVSWCVFTPVDGDSVCTLHRAHPVLHSGERADDWRKRVASEKRAADRSAAREAAKQAEAAKKAAGAAR